MAKLWRFIFLINFFPTSKIFKIWLSLSQNDKCTENLSRYKNSQKFWGHVVEQLFIRNIIVHRLKITLIAAHAQLPRSPIGPTAPISPFGPSRPWSPFSPKLCFNNNFKLSSLWKAKCFTKHLSVRNRSQKTFAFFATQSIFNI